MRSKKYILIFLVVAFTQITLDGNAQEWKPAGDRIKTAWSKKVEPSNPLSEYPSPQMVRDRWKNLNGLWDYTIVPKGSFIPSSFDGKILVPFAIESSLSGVQKNVGSENELWYRCVFEVPSSWKGNNILLHFGAVDWQADIWVNGIKIGTHKGGYTPFSFDIKPFLKKEKKQELLVKVWDPTNDGFQPRGKQVKKPRSIWYTPVTGVWQTVWLEPVGEIYIKHVKTIPNIDGNIVSVQVTVDGALNSDIIEVNVFEDDNIVATGKAKCGQAVFLGIENAKLWSPETPYLYEMEVSVLSIGTQRDRVRSYFGMRKISTKRDENNIVRLQLNNKDYFQFGPLDQGWWPDGLYTAPTDDALRYDIKKTKDFGFNMIRKHVKVEPARWYYHADKEGILVWQDMPSGDDYTDWQNRKYFDGKELERSAESEADFRQEWKEVMDLTISNPSVVVWVPFNERWGQFKTEEIAEWTKNYDPSCLVNAASRGNYYYAGDMLDTHHYPDPEIGMVDPNKANVLGEYGGIGLVIEGHVWEDNKNWGYVKYKDKKEATEAYLEMIKQLKKLIPVVYSAAVYTQTTDVESEVNGIMTYDRKIVKMDEAKIRKANQEVCNSLNNNSKSD